MSALTKEALLAAATVANLPRERLDIPELGGYVWIRGMSGKERDEWEQSNYVIRRGKVEPHLEHIRNSRARLAVRTLVDESGARLFGNEDAALLGNLRADVLSKIFATAQRLSNVTDEDIDELKKSSETAAAGSDSPTS